MRIAFDAHGGDHAPQAVIEGVLRAAKRWNDTHFIMLSKERSLFPEGVPNLEFRQVTESILPEDEPVRAARRKKDSSIVVGCQMVADQQADAFISAGNTGALMAASLFTIGRIHGVERPALAPVFPTKDRKGILVLDVGANPEAKAEHLLQYAFMGSVYADKVMQIERPRIGLLNIGSETGKGTTLTKDAYKLIEKTDLNFVGNIEARDVFERTCDVLVCDGFSGNILLKNAEGVSKILFEQLKEVFMGSWINRMGAMLIAPSLKQLKQNMDYREYGGAPLFGLNGSVIKAHGSSDANAIFHAVRQARLLIQNDVIQKMKQAMGTKEE